MPTTRQAFTGGQCFGAILATVLFVGLGLAMLVVTQSSLDVQPGSRESAERELEQVRKRFGDAQPYIVVETRGERQVATARSHLEPPHPASIRIVRGIAWSPALGRVAHLSTPYWVFKATRWKAKALTGIARSFSQQLGLDFELPDLGRFGRGLVFDEHYPDGRRIIVWTE